MKLPLEPVADKNQFGEVDVQTRYYDPLLSSILADTTKKVVLRWPNKKDTLTIGIRPDAIVSTLVQRAFGQSLGFGEVKLGAESTSNHFLCINTVKLTVLSRISVLRCGHPTLTSQVNGKKKMLLQCVWIITISKCFVGFQLVFYMTQMIHTNFFTRIEIVRITLSESLSCLHSFVTLKNIRTRLRVTLIFGHCCYQADSPTDVVAPVSTPSPMVTYPIQVSTFSPSATPDTTQLLQMINNTTSKSRDYSIQYN